MGSMHALLHASHGQHARWDVYLQTLAIWGSSEVKAGVGLLYSLSACRTPYWRSSLAHVARALQSNPLAAAWYDHSNPNLFERVHRDFWTHHVLVKGSREGLREGGVGPVGEVQKGHMLSQQIGQGRIRV